MSITNLSAQQLRQAANLKDQIATLEKQLIALTGTKAAAPKATQPAKARWAKVRAEKAAKK